MRNKPVQFSNSQTRRASSARSFRRKCLTAKFFVVSGCALAARNIQGRYTWNVIDVAPFSIRAFFSSGYRGLSCFAEHSSDRIPDHFQAPSPLSFQGRFHVLKHSAEVFGNVRKVVGEIRNV